MLLLEDLHWSDFGTVRFIDVALRDRCNQPWMVLALARAEVFEVSASAARSPARCNWSALRWPTPRS